MPTAFLYTFKFVSSIRSFIPKRTQYIKKNLMQQVFEAASTRPTEFVLANLAVHVGAPIVFLNQGGAPRAILNKCS